MLAIDAGSLAVWLLASVAGALALLALVLAIRRTVTGSWPRRRTVTWLAAGVGGAAVVVPVAAIVIYTQLINDPEPAFDRDDLSQLISGGTDTTAAVLAALVALDAADTPPTSEPAGAGCLADLTSTEPPATPAADGEGFDGVWAVAEQSEVGYRVPELLAGVDTEAVGRTNEVDGSLTVSGNEIPSACFVVDVATIQSDDGMRDGQFTGRIMQTSDFPTATFVLTEPIVLDELPEVGGDPITAEATGELTMRGISQTVTFEVTAQAGEGIIGVLGSIPVTFADYGIGDVSMGPARVGDTGSVEFLLAFTPTA